MENGTQIHDNRANPPRGYREGIEYSLEEGEKVEDLGICALVDVENMGFCKDDVTRWYHFTNNAGEPCIYIKH